MTRLLDYLYAPLGQERRLLAVGNCNVTAQSHDRARVKST